MYSVLIWTTIIGYAILTLWLLALSYFFWREKKLKEDLFPNQNLDGNKDGYTLLIEKMENFAKVVDEGQRRDEILNKHLKEIAKDGLHHIQKVEVSRYNPYEDMGGDQSFTFVMLTGNLDGVLITSLHSRAGTRVYAKNIKNGKSDLELSKEEKLVLEKAINS